jgi:hypothetical protein
MGASPLQQTCTDTSHKLINGVALEVWKRGSFSNIAYWSETSNLFLEVWEQGPFSKHA